MWCGTGEVFHFNCPTFIEIILRKSFSDFLVTVSSITDDVVDSAASLAQVGRSDEISSREGWSLLHNS